MQNEYDFTQATRGKFYREDAELHLPVYLDAEVQATLMCLAKARGIELSVLVNDLLKKDIELIQMVS